MNGLSTSFPHYSSVSCDVIVDGRSCADSEAGRGYWAGSGGRQAACGTVRDRAGCCGTVWDTRLFRHRTGEYCCQSYFIRAAALVSVTADSKYK